MAWGFYLEIFAVLKVEMLEEAKIIFNLMIEEQNVYVL